MALKEGLQLLHASQELTRPPTSFAKLPRCYLTPPSACTSLRQEWIPTCNGNVSLLCVSR